MKLFTGADQRSMQGLLAEQRLRDQQNHEWEKEKEREKISKMAVEFGMGLQEIAETSKSVEEFDQKKAEYMNGWKEKGMTEPMYNLFINVSKSFNDGLRAKEQSAQNKQIYDNQQTLFNKEMNDDNALASFLRTSQNPNDDRMKRVARSTMSGQGLLNWEDIQNKREDRRTKQEYDKLKMSNERLRQDKLKQSPTNLDSDRILYKPDGSQIKVYTQDEYKNAIQQGFSPVKPPKNDKPSDMDRFKYIEKAVEDAKGFGELSKADINNLRQQKGTEFDAYFGGWKQITSPDGVPHYQKPDGVIVDITSGMPIKQKIKTTGDNENGSSSTKKQTSIKHLKNSKYNSLPNLNNDSRFKNSMESLLGKYGVNSSPEVKKVLQITKGVLAEDGSVTFKPQNEKELREVLIELGTSGIQYKPEKNKDGSVTITPISGKPKMLLGN